MMLTTNGQSALIASFKCSTFPQRALQVATKTCRPTRIIAVLTQTVRFLKITLGNPFTSTIFNFIIITFPKYNPNPILNPDGLHTFLSVSRLAELS